MLQMVGICIVCPDFFRIYCGVWDAMVLAILALHIFANIFAVVLSIDAIMSVLSRHQD